MVVVNILVTIQSYKLVAVYEHLTSSSSFSLVDLHRQNSKKRDWKHFD